MSSHNDSQQHDQFNAVWGNPRGWRALTIVNHTTIGLRRREAMAILVSVGAEP